MDGVPFAHTQARRADRVRATVRDLLVDLEVETDTEAFDVAVTNASEEIQRLVATASEARIEAQNAAAAAAAALAGAIAAMRDEGYSYRDAALFLDLSYQRVQQIDRAPREITHELVS